MTTSNRRMWALSLAVVLGAVAAACAEDTQVSIVRSDQDGRTSVPATDPDDTVTVTEVVTTVADSEPPRTTVPMTLPSIPTTPPEESVPDDTSFDDEGPVIDVPDELLPLGDPASTFTWDDPYGSGDSVDVVLAALVEVPVSEYEDRAGQCYALVGSFTATNVSAGIVISSFRTPPLYAAANGTAAETGFGSCDLADLEAAGFGWTYNIATTVGTTYLFYEPFFVEGAGATLDAVVLGDVYFGDDLTFFSPTVTAALPTIPTQMGTSIAEGTTLAPVGDPTLSTFTFASEYSPDDQWSGTISGLVELPLSSFAEVSGRCYAVVGSLVPTAIAEGDLSSPYTAPDFEVIGDGHELADGYMNCDDSVLEPAGYDYYLDAEVALNTPFWFWSSYFVPTGAAETRLEAIVVGPAISDDHLLFTPTVLPSIPPVG